MPFITMLRGCVLVATALFGEGIAALRQIAAVSAQLGEKLAQ